MTVPFCWICNKSPATSGEHKVKKSDFTLVMGEPSQTTPNFLHSVKRKNIHVRSANADVLKFKKSICETCNTTLTQPHDRSYEALSNFLHSIPSLIQSGNTINLGIIFPTDTKQHILNTHLYFIKHFGCFLKNGVGEPTIDKKTFLQEEDVNAVLPSLSNAILKNAWHPDLYMGFGRTPFEERQHQVGSSNLSVSEDPDGNLIRMEYFNYVGLRSVRILYDPTGHFHTSQTVNHVKYGFDVLTMRHFGTDWRDRVY